MEPVRWLLRRQVPAPTCKMTIGIVARVGNLEAVQLLHERFHVPLTADLLYYAAMSGSVPTATWLLQAGCPMSPSGYLGAAVGGGADMVLWLAREAKCPWDDSTLGAVICHWPSGSKGRTALLPVVRALVEAGCPHGAAPTAGGEQCYTAGSLNEAAARGGLPLLRYLHEEVGLGFGPGTMAEAARGGCEAVLEWLVEAGCGPGTGYPYVRAAAHGDLATLCCLHRLGVPFGDASWLREVTDASVWDPRAVRCAPLAAFRWMVERGAPWSQKGVKKLIKSDAVHVDEESLSWFKARMAWRVRWGW